MIDIHIIAINPMSLHIREWDVKAINGTYLGVVEELDDGFMYTDSFGHTTNFFDGESLTEVRDWVADSINNTTLH